MKSYTFLFTLIAALVAFSTPAHAECGIAYTSAGGGKVSLTADMCAGMLVPWQNHATGEVDYDHVEAWRDGERFKLAKGEVDFSTWTVEYTYLLSPDTPVDVKRLKGNTFGVIFDPSEWDTASNAMVGNLQVRSPDADTVVFVNLGAVRPTENGEPCNNCIVSKPTSMGGTGKELAISFKHRFGKS